MFYLQVVFTDFLGIFLFEPTFDVNHCFVPTMML